jgi:energy-coupling factor transport system ATP-binding protein
MQNKDVLIKIKDLKYAYEPDEGQEQVFALDGVSLDIHKGEFVAIVGRNGSGKSTLSLCMNALLIPTEGKVFVDGMDTEDESMVWEIRKKVGMVFQDPDNQLVSSIIEDDVAFGPENLGLPSEEIRRRVDEALKAVEMYDYRKKGPHLLSGGQKQRIAIAGVIAMRTECIVFDEATAMLDPLGRKEIMSIIKKLHSEGHSIVIITHFMEEAAQADKIVVMSEGKKVMEGAPSDIFEKKEELEKLYLDIPFAVKMASALREKGFDIPREVVTEDQLADVLCGSK